MDLRGNAVTWLGHGTWLWETSEGRRVLIDPWLAGNPACPDEWKDPSAARPDAILLSHGHFDHVGDAMSVIEVSPDATTVAIWEVGQELMDQRAKNVIQMNKGGTVEVAGLRATMVDARHSGHQAGYVLELADGLVVYQAGDTDVFGDMALIAEIYRPHVCVLPVGDHFTMGPRQAAHAVRLLGATQVICGHFGTFPVLTGTPAALRELVGPGVEIPDMTPGKRLP